MRLPGSEIGNQFLRFALVGAVGTAVQYTVLFLGVEFLSIYAAVASAIGFLLGAVTNYFLNYFLTFGSRSSHLATGSRFAVLVAIGWCLNLAAMGFFAHMLGWHYFLAQVFTTLSCLLWNFSASRWWAFREV